MCLEVTTLVPFVGGGVVAREGAWGSLLAAAKVLRLDLSGGHLDLYTCRHSLRQRFVEVNSLSALHCAYVKLKIEVKEN